MEVGLRNSSRYQMARSARKKEKEEDVHHYGDLRLRLTLTTLALAVATQQSPANKKLDVHIEETKLERIYQRYSKPIANIRPLRLSHDSDVHSIPFLAIKLP